MDSVKREPGNSATNSTAFIYNTDVDIKIEEGPALATQSTDCYGDNTSSDPYAVDVKSFTTGEWPTSPLLKYEIMDQDSIKKEDQDSIKKEPCVDSVVSNNTVIQCNINNIKTELPSAETNNYVNNSDKEAIKNEELILKDEDFGVIEVHSSSEADTANDDTLPSGQLSKEIQQCPKCNYETVRTYNLRQHMQLKHKQGPPNLDFTKYVCPICKKSFLRKLGFENHIFKNHSGNKDLMKTIEHTICKCQQCSFKCVSSSILYRHTLKVHKTDSQKFYCTYCVYSTDVKSELRKHLAGHNSHLCTGCGKKFSNKQIMDNHIIVKHADNKQLIAKVKSKLYSCPQCSFKSISNHRIKYHILVRHNQVQPDMIKMYCAHCMYTTYFKERLVQHLLTHRNTNPHVCTDCSKTFNFKANFDIHIVRDHPDNKHLMAKVTYKFHKCQHCSYVTLNNTHFKRHNRSYHWKR